MSDLLNELMRNHCRVMHRQDWDMAKTFCLECGFMLADVPLHFRECHPEIYTEVGGAEAAKTAAREARQRHADTTDQEETD